MSKIVERKQIMKVGAVFFDLLKIVLKINYGTDITIKLWILETTEKQLVLNKPWGRKLQHIILVNLRRNPLPF